MPAPPAAWYGVTVAADRAWVDAKTGPQPLASFAQPVRLARPAPRDATYILCTQPVGFQRAADQSRQMPGWRHRELATGHDAMITAPEPLSRLLLELVG